MAAPAVGNALPYLAQSIPMSQAGVFATLAIQASDAAYTGAMAASTKSSDRFFSGPSVLCQPTPIAAMLPNRVPQPLGKKCAAAAMGMQIAQATMLLLVPPAELSMPLSGGSCGQGHM